MELIPTHTVCPGNIILFLVQHTTEMEATAPSAAPPEATEVSNPDNPPTASGPVPATSTDLSATLPSRPAEPKISKAAAKKEAKKAANKAIKQEAKKGPSPKTPSNQAPSAKTQTTSTHAEDPESMFKVGFLADVYKERPVGSDGTKMVVTRCGWNAHLSKR